MNFSVFPVGTVNIFPYANDHSGGQLMTEYNLKSRETVDTSETIKYICGHSYTHAEEDFMVRIQTDGAGSVISSSVLEILPGRAIIDGHYIESLTNITIDMLEANANAQLQGLEPLKGRLTVGLRAMYSTDQTMAGALMPYNAENIYEGIQVVVLPSDQFFTPIDRPTQQDQVTAHLKLADFNFINGAINTVVNNYPGKVQNISADRIGNVDRLLSDIYVKKTGLNPKKLYTFSGKGTDPATGLDTWCDSTDSLMIWDSNPILTNTAPQTREASFGTKANGYTTLYLPHKQVDGMKDTAGNNQYYADKIIDLPLANYSEGTAGTVDRNYTNNIKAVAEKLNNIYRMPNGKQVGYIPILDSREDLPAINTNWNVGDYIVVGQDNTVDEMMDAVSPPSTMYIVLAGIVSAYTYHSVVKNSSTVPSSLTGIELARYEMDAQNGDVVNTSDSEVYSTYFDLSPNYRGVVNKDYFRIHYIESTDAYSNYYFAVSQSGERGYSDPVHLTAQIPLATEDTIGGFYNVPETTLDGGYVYRDENGHLRLLDYSLLRSGTLAYQLGEDFEVPSGLAHTEVQANLNEYVNQRVAFPNSNQIENSETPNIINITITLAAEDEESTINIYDIDSRFNTCVYLHINGTADDKCTINILNCQKIRIDSNIGGTPKINLQNSCLYYDSSVIDKLDSIINMSLWYEQYEDTDPNLLVDGMTVRAIDEPIIPDDMDYWNVTAPNDNHYMYALQSITFSPNGEIVGAGLYVKNDTSSNVSEGKTIISSTFSLPQGAGLTYPKSKLTRQIKITGSFVTAYVSDSGYMTMDTNFTALTDKTSAYDTTDVTDGVIAFLTDATLVTSITGLDNGTPLDCWESNAFHVFYGVAV